VYHPAFHDHFHAPRGQGDLPGATHRGEARDPACGDWMALALCVEAGTVRAARFRVAGCPGAIAVGSALASLLPGRVAEATAVPTAELEATLGEVPALKRHALRLAQAALEAALAGPVAPAPQAPSPPARAS
jgi:NifU-like protein involved in Fe-S cluster formation